MLLKLRVNDNIKQVCDYHENKNLKKYNNFYGYRCCDPFEVHKKAVIKSLREISLDYSLKFRQL